jgi:hypothetical protein
LACGTCVAVSRLARWLAQSGHTKSLNLVKPIQSPHKVSGFGFNADMAH